MSLCQCGCGAAVGPAERPSRPIRYLPGHHRRKSPVQFVVVDCGYETPCHIWQMATNGKQGYGVAWDPAQKRQRLAHVLAWEREHGPVPADRELDHLCRQRRCVNPTHLEAVPGHVNRERGLRGILKTHCAQGHPWIPENISRRSASGQRRCLICDRARAARRRALAKAA